MSPLVELMGLGCGVESVGPELSLAFLPRWTLLYLTLCSTEDRATPGTEGGPLCSGFSLVCPPSLPTFPSLHSLKWYSLRAVVTLCTCSHFQRCRCASDSFGSLW